MSVRGPKVLVVEDDADLRTVYQGSLSLAGYVVVGVEDGIEALRRLDADGFPDALVLDLGLPRLSGIDVHRELRALAKTERVPVIVVTGSDAPEIDQLDFDCVLRKPVTPESLVRAVENCLKSTR